MRRYTDDMARPSAATPLVFSTVRRAIDLGELEVSLPASGRPAKRRALWPRGAGTLERPITRLRADQRADPARGGRRADLGDHALRVRHRDEAVPGLAAVAAGTAAAAGDQHLRHRGARRRAAVDAARARSRRRPVDVDDRAGAHRKRPDVLGRGRDSTAVGSARGRRPRVGRRLRNGILVARTTAAAPGGRPEDRQGLRRRHRRPAPSRVRSCAPSS